MAEHPLLASVNLTFDLEGQTLICRTCQYALATSRSQVTSHLWEKHHIPSNGRKGLTAYIRSLNLPDPANIAPRPDGSPIHPTLKLHRGYACRTCKYRTINLDMI